MMQLSSSPVVVVVEYETQYRLVETCKTHLEVKQVHGWAIKTSTITHPHISSKLLSLYSDPIVGNLDHATSLFNQIQHPSAFSWNTIIKSHVDHHRSQDALLLLSQLLRQSTVTPDHFLLPCVIKGCTRLSALPEGKQLHGFALKIGLGLDSYVQSSLISFYSKANDIAGAHKVFRTVQYQTLPTSNSLLDAYARCGDLHLAHNLFDQMPHKDSFSWTALIDAYSKSGQLGIARKLFDQMPHKNLITWNAMINGCIKAGDCESAEHLFNTMPQDRNVVTWNSMISGYESNGRHMEALNFFHAFLDDQHLSPNNSTLVPTLSAVSALSLLQKGRWIHSYIDRKGFKLDGVLGTALIQMYSRCGSVDGAFNVFRGISNKKLGHWTAMIVGFGAHGMANRALELFNEMQRIGIKPHPITFIGILNACSHAGKVKEGCRYFQLMKQDYGIEATIEHYGCFVDLLCRGGHLKEALSVIMKMPMKPNKVIWMSLLSGCRMHRNIDVAEYAAKHTIELDPEAIGSYVLLSNVYAAAGQWDRVSKVRQSMKEKGIRKIPGCSFIEHNETLHRFIVGDRSHPQTAQIYSKLNEMSDKLKCAGYIPDLTQVLLYIEGEKEKEAELGHHSERLAIAFGLINVKPGRPIRVVKNLRVCNDCHTVTKLLSSIYGREIIVRDNSRFHHFENGLCSCMDYW